MVPSGVKGIVSFTACLTLNEDNPNVLKNLPYKLNNDFFLIKKNKIEENLKQKPIKESKKEETTNSKKPIKNSSLIFGNKK